MDFSSSFKKSFKSHGSYKHTRKISVGNSEEDTNAEQQPILSDHQRDFPIVDTHHKSLSPIDFADRREVIVKIDGGDRNTTPNNISTIRRESSLDFWRDEGNSSMQKGSFDFQRGDGKDVAEDPPSRLIGQFLNKQRAAGGELSLDMELEMDELHEHRKTSNIDNININPCFSMSRELKVSYQSPSMNKSTRSDVVNIMPDKQEQTRDEDGSSSEEDDDDDEHDNQKLHNRRPLKNMEGSFHNGIGDDGQVLTCTSIQRRASVLGRLKTKSRLMDPPVVPERRSTNIKSGGLRPGLPGRVSDMMSKPAEEEEEDPLFDEDFPDEYKKAKRDTLTLAQWISLILIVTALCCTMSISKWKRKQLRGLRLWKWEVLVLVLICGRLVSGWAIRIVVFFIERNFFMRKRILYFVYGIRKAVQNCIWLGLVLLAWHYMFDKKVEGNNEFLRYVNKLMVCMLVGTLLWLVKTLMVKVLASSFHVSTFFDRIQESLFNQFVIEKLSGPPLLEIQNQKEEEERTMAEIWQLKNAGATLPSELGSHAFQDSRSGNMVSARGGGLPPKIGGGGEVSFRISGQLPKTNQDDQGISIDHLHKLNPKNVSAWNMKRLMNIVRNGVLSTLDEQVIDSSTGDESATQIGSEREAKGAARKIFRNVAQPRAKFIYLEDLMRFLREEEALKTMNLVEGSPEKEKISKACLKNWVVNAFRERRALALTLNDTKTAVKKLHQMVNVLVGIIILIICLIILEIATSRFLLFVSSQIVVVAFIFGNTCKTVFEAIIFVFVMHPFDVGDRCEVDGVQMIVEEMNILTTVFLRFDNLKVLYPNSTLATKSISNFYRSPDMGDSIEFYVHIATPAEKIAIMKQRVVNYIENKKDHWYPSPSVVLMNIEDLNKLKLSVWIRHRMNHQDMGEKWQRRALLVDEMVKIFKELDIEYRLYPLDINIRSMPPLNASQQTSTWTRGN
ncbi:mechanosensitive ion channel protein 6-like [Olea europaea var. sylvestris]|uniref:mechanosensitive ion channel protein 6-like n=1 Tax=Olea europaea var. sylvestris TaxID=158386 RepID=UPI000C1D15C2|nr:mechanosensitive ion channel protein 6-like [Olea europaea var. sylvestris]